MKVFIAFAGDMSGSGGMQKACVTLANGLSGRGHSVVIGYGDTSKPVPFFPLHREIPLRSLLQLSLPGASGSLGYHISGKDKMVREMLRLGSRKSARNWNERSKAKVIQKGIRQILKDFKPDVVLSFSPDMSYYLSYAGCTAPVITLFRIEPKYILSIAPEGEIEALRHSAALQIQMPFFEKEIREYSISTPVCTIPNPVAPVETPVSYGEKQKYRIISVARLDKKQKRQHLLIEAFSKTAGQFPQWNLEFWGSGTAHPDYAESLKKQVESHHLENRISFKGETKKISRVYEQTDLFVFPSAFEGFPNALAEAMSYGIPVIAMKDCPSSAALVKDGETGLLAENTEDLASKMSRLMKDRELREKLGKNGRQSMEAYTPDHIFEKWEVLMEKVSGNK